MRKEEKYDYYKKALEEYINYYNRIKEAFYDYYGEENVDFQDSNCLPIIEQRIEDYIEENNLEILNEDTLKTAIITILESSRNCANVIVRRGNFKITNEIGLSHDIKEFWIKFSVSLSGVLLKYPTFTRSWYTLEELNSEYIHSHIRASSDITSFKDFCFGRNPIKDTFQYLRSNTNPCIWIWTSMFKQLDDTIKTESLRGGPYIKIQDIKKKSIIDNFTDKRFKINNSILNKDSIIPIEALNISIEDKKRILSKICKDYINNEKLSYNFNPITGIKLNVSHKDFILKVGYYLYKELEGRNETDIKKIEDLLNVKYYLLEKTYLSELRRGFKDYLNLCNEKKIEIMNLALDYDFKGEKVYIKKQYDNLDIENLIIIKLPSLSLIQQAYNIITDILKDLTKKIKPYEKFPETKWFL